MSELPITNSIQELRATYGAMTQFALAKRLGVIRLTGNTIEQGKYSPSLEAVIKIAAMSGLHPEQVFQSRQ